MSKVLIPQKIGSAFRDTLSLRLIIHGTASEKMTLALSNETIATWANKNDNMNVLERALEEGYRVERRVTLSPEERAKQDEYFKKRLDSLKKKKQNLDN